MWNLLKDLKNSKRMNLRTKRSNLMKKTTMRSKRMRSHKSRKLFTLQRGRTFATFIKLVEYDDYFIALQNLSTYSNIILQSHLDKTSLHRL